MIPALLRMFKLLLSYSESENIFYADISGTCFVKQVEWLKLVWRSFPGSGEYNDVHSWLFYFSEWINDLLNATCWDRDGFLFFFSLPPRSLHTALVTMRPVKTLRNNSTSQQSLRWISWPNARILGSEEVKLWAEEGLCHYTPI